MKRNTGQKLGKKLFWFGFAAAIAAACESGGGTNVESAGPPCVNGHCPECWPSDSGMGCTEGEACTFTFSEKDFLCLPEKFEGEECSTADDTLDVCVDGFLCETVEARSETGLCLGAEFGAPCGKTNTCADGFICDEVNGYGPVCVAACDSHSECPGCLSCIDGLCTEWYDCEGDLVCPEK